LRVEQVAQRRQFLVARGIGGGEIVRHLEVPAGGLLRLLDVASAKQGDVVFVSAAAGAVGSVVVQLAKAKGMIVVGSAGGAEKSAFVRSLGADQVIDYRDGPVLKNLAAAAPAREYARS